MQSLITDGLAVTVGDNPNGQDALLKLADPAEPGGDGDRHVGGHRHRDQRARRRADPRDHERATRRRPDARARATCRRRSSAARRCTSSPTRATTSAAAAWDYIQFLVGAESQSTWAAATGYVPVREDALELEPLTTTYATDPRFKVAYDQLLAGGDDPTSLGPVLGPLREVRTVTAGAVAAIFGGADVQPSTLGRRGRAVQRPHRRLQRPQLTPELRRVAVRHGRSMAAAST